MDPSRKKKKFEADWMNICSVEFQIDHWEGLRGITVRLLFVVHIIATRYGVKPANRTQGIQSVINHSYSSGLCDCV